MSRKRIVHHPKGMAFIYQKLNGLRPYKTLPHQLCTHKVRSIASLGRTHDVVGTIPRRHGPITLPESSLGRLEFPHPSRRRPPPPGGPGVVGSTRAPRRDPRKGSGEYDSVVGTCRRRRAPEPPPVPALRAGVSLKDMPHPHTSTDDPGVTQGCRSRRG